ncbi:hypothetical protein K443DRAFT_102262, partial [Laccaria amethystina LaAM-08-1]
VASTLLRPSSPLQILTLPSEFTSPTSPASLRADPSQLHGAEAEAVRNFDEVLQSRRSIWFPYNGWHSALPLISFRLNTPFHLESLVFKFYFPLPSDSATSASSSQRYPIAKSPLHC